ncbi:MAG: Na/Pi symporter [Gammaproteobacteria bacterium]|nr:Na/Pi symporter [Gammaproteobacteria bacterium]
MFHIMVEVLGGIGLFFVGINLLSDNIKKFGSGYAPGIIRHYSRNDLSSSIGGLLAGAVTSSGKAVTFTLIALAELGQLNLRRCLPIVMGGSVGSAFIVLWASLDFKTLVFILMAVAGGLSQFGNKKSGNIKLITNVVLGFALLFYGLELIKMGAAPVKELPWFNDYMHASQGHWMVALLVGAMLAFLSQSGSSVAIIAMSLVNANLLGFDEAVMLVFGTNVGSGISTAMLGLGLSGLGRQLVLFHGFFKTIGVVVMVPLLAIEVYGEVHLMKDLVHHMSDSPSTQIALIYLLYEVVTGVAVAGFLSPIARWFEPHPPQVPLQRKTPVTMPRKNRVRIVLAYPEGAVVTPLVEALESEGIAVMLADRYAADWRRILRDTRVDAMLVELDADLDKNFFQLETLLEEVSIPVVFNEFSLSNAEDDLAQISKKLAVKLAPRKQTIGAAGNMVL